MKKIILTTIMMAGAVAAFGQGQVNIGNLFTSGVLGRTPIYNVEPVTGAEIHGQSSIGTASGTTVYGGALLQGTGFTFALFGAASSVTDPNLLTTLITSVPFRTAASNILPAGTIVTLGSFAFPTQSTDFAIGGFASLEVRAWNNAGGTILTWAQALSSGADKGRSGRFLSPQLGGTSTAGVFLPANMATGWTSFNLVPAPEPSSFVLAGLGAASLLLFRRRK